MVIQRPTGTDDRLPAQQAAWKHVTDQAERTATQFGYGRIDTPTFEETALFVRGVGEGTDLIERETYSFTDRGGTRLTLRSEGTAPTMRAYLQDGLQSMPTPLRLYYIAPVFRYDRPQKGRLREHHQFGLEAIGEADAAVDAEVIAVLARTFRAIGLRDVSMQLNSIGDDQCRPAYIEQLVAYYRPRIDQACTDCRVRLEKNPLRLLDCKEERCQPLIAAAPKPVDALCAPCAEHFARLRHHLEVLGVPYTLNRRLVRGLGYYTRTVFEFYTSERGAQSALGGGGRYDGLIAELGGRPTPAVGFGAGIERWLLALEEQGVAPPPSPRADAYVCHLGAEAQDWADELAMRLRDAGLIAVATPGTRKLPAQFRQAEHYGARYAVIVGSEEAAGRVATLRDMTTKTERRNLDIDSLVAALRAP
jgi:histidyl-tRNA synthetase